MGLLGPSSEKGTPKIQTPDRSISQESQMHYSVNRQLALSSLKSNTKAIKFDGKDKGSYSSWKIALELETEGLFLSDAEWLELLQLRTTEVALQVVKRGRELALVDAGEALQYIWDNFNKNSVLSQCLHIQSFKNIGAKLWS